MKAVTVLVAGLALALGAAATPTRPWTDAEIAEIDRQPSHADRTPLDLLPDSKHRFRDGAKGYLWSIDSKRRMEELRPEFASLDEQRLQWELCLFDTLMLARAREPLARLNASRTMIYTKVDVEVVDVFKSGLNLQPGDIVPVIRLGGEVQFGEQLLRVHEAGFKPYADGGLYLLRLSKAETSGLLFDTQNLNVAVRDDVVRPDARQWHAIVRGQPYADMRATLRRLLSFACR